VEQVLRSSQEFPATWTTKLINIKVWEPQKDSYSIKDHRIEVLLKKGADWLWWMKPERRDI
jgi:hypothetical protein